MLRHPDRPLWPRSRGTRAARGHPVRPRRAPGPGRGAAPRSDRAEPGAARGARRRLHRRRPGREPLVGERDRAEPAASHAGPRAAAKGLAGVTFAAARRTTRGHGISLCPQGLPGRVRGAPLLRIASQDTVDPRRVHHTVSRTFHRAARTVVAQSRTVAVHRRPSRSSRTSAAASRPEPKAGWSYPVSPSRPVTPGLISQLMSRSCVTTNDRRSATRSAASGRSSSAT
jgi:hypothetical protein